MQTHHLIETMILGKTIKGRIRIRETILNLMKKGINLLYQAFLLIRARIKMQIQETEERYNKNTNKKNLPLPPKIPLLVSIKYF
jgi:hypothetical protein